jgi:dTDP-4-dehydrorhamnose 3,5-epimerase
MAGVAKPLVNPKPTIEFVGGDCSSRPEHAHSTGLSGMLFTKTSVGGAWIIDPSPHRDDRGHFQRAWCVREFEQQGLNFLPVQANMQFSFRKGTVRGMHLQVAPAPEAKLVRCTRGAVFDVALDLRPDSPSYGDWCSVELTAENGRMLYVPEQCAHGFQSIEEHSEVLYMTSAFYAPEAVRGIRFDDPAFGIRWPLPVTSISEQDRNWPLSQASSSMPARSSALKERSL